MKKTILLIVALLLLYIFIFDILKVNGGKAIFMLDFYGGGLSIPQP